MLPDQYDQALLRRYQSGDNIAFDEFYERNKKHCHYSVDKCCLENPVPCCDREDSTHTAMMNLAVKTRTCGLIPDNPSRYVRWSARNSYLNRQRKLNRGVIEENATDVAAEDGQQPGSEYAFFVELTGVDEVDKIDLRIDLKDALNSLPEFTARVTRMRAFDRYDFEEIASLLGVDRSTVFRHWKAGRERLAKVFDEYAT